MTRLILNWLLVFVLLATTIFAVPESVAESQKKAETGAGGQFTTGRGKKTSLDLVAAISSMSQDLMFAAR
jgi:hypothetical protein